MKFKAGQSGNPSGRPKGIVDRRATFRQALERESPEALKNIIQALVEKAEQGDVAAARLLLDRISAPLRAKSEPAPFDLPDGDLVIKGNAVLEAIAAGEMSADDAADVMQTLAALGRITELHDLEQRIKKLEEKSGGTQ